MRIASRHQYGVDETTQFIDWRECTFCIEKARAMKEDEARLRLIVREEIERALKRPD